MRDFDKKDDAVLYEIHRRQTGKIGLFTVKYTTAMVLNLCIFVIFHRFFRYISNVQNIEKCGQKCYK